MDLQETLNYRNAKGLCEDAGLNISQSNARELVGGPVERYILFLVRLSKNKIFSVKSIKEISPRVIKVLKRERGPNKIEIDINYYWVATEIKDYEIKVFLNKLVTFCPKFVGVYKFKYNKYAYFFKDKYSPYLLKPLNKTNLENIKKKLWEIELWIYILIHKKMRKTHKPDIDRSVCRMGPEFKTLDNYMYYDYGVHLSWAQNAAEFLGYDFPKTKSIIKLLYPKIKSLGYKTSRRKAQKPRSRRYPVFNPILKMRTETLKRKVKKLKENYID